MSFQTGGSERVRVDTSGNVGIGTSSPTRLLTLSGSGVNTRVQINNTVSGKNFGLYAVDDGNSIINYGSSAALIFTESGTERMRIDSSGNVGIGTSFGTRKLNVYGGASGTRTMAVVSNASEGLEVGVNASNIAAINSAAGGAIIFTQADTERARIDSSGNFLFNSGYGSVATAYGCRAWVNFDGTSTPPSIRASGNVSSISRQATGQFTVNFSTALSSNYSIVGGGKVSDNNTTTSQICSFFFHTFTTTSAQFNSQDAGTLRSPLLGNIAVFR
jgi:hypothetical protein